jgi:hypothetical protein
VPSGIDSKVETTMIFAFDPVLRRLPTLLRSSGLSDDEIRRQWATQQVVYLLQAVGVELGYHFTWEPGGPFCSELASDLDELSRLFEVQFPEEGIQRPEACVAAKVRSIVDGARSMEPGLEWLSLITALHFLNRLGPQRFINGDEPAFVAKADAGLLEAARRGFESLMPEQRLSASL